MGNLFTKRLLNGAVSLTVFGIATKKLNIVYLPLETTISRKLSMPVNPFKKLLGKLASRKVNRNARRARLRFENLEERRVFAGIVIEPPSPTQTFTWTGNSDNDFWSTPENWVSEPAGEDDDGVPDESDDVVFDGGSGLSVMNLGQGGIGYGGDGGYGGYGGGYQRVRSLSLDWEGDLFIDGELEVEVQADWKAGRISGRQSFGNELATLIIGFEGMLEISGDGMKTLDHDIVNHGSTLWSSGVIRWDDEAQFVNYGDFEASTNTQIQSITEGFVDDFQNYGDFTVTGDTIFVGVGFTNQGTVQIEQGGTLTVPSYDQYSSFSEGGSRTNLYGILNSPTVFLEAGFLAGNGTINGSVNNNGGTVSPNNPGNTIGQLVINGNYVQTGGALRVDVSSTGMADKLVVNGEAVLGGALNVIRIGTPVIGDQFVVLSFARRNGDFATKTGLAPAEGRVLAPVYNPNNLTLISEFTNVVAPNEVTGSVRLTFVGCTWNSRSRTWIQTVSITNTSATSIAGPFYLVFDGPANLVANRTGITASGKAYIRVNIASLAPGASTPFITLSTTTPVRPNRVFAGEGVLVV